jgi:hypothetical protein
MTVQAQCLTPNAPYAIDGVALALAGQPLPETWNGEPIDYPTCDFLVTGAHVEPPTVLAYTGAGDVAVGFALGAGLVLAGIGVLGALYWRRLTATARFLAALAGRKP